MNCESFGEGATRERLRVGDRGEMWIVEGKKKVKIIPNEPRDVWLDDLMMNTIIIRLTNTVAIFCYVEMREFISEWLNTHVVGGLDWGRPRKNYPLIVIRKTKCMRFKSKI